MKKFLLNLLLAGILGMTFFAAFVALSITAFVWGPVVESKMFPVVGKLEMLAVRDGVFPDTIEIDAGFNKLRPCEYIGISWFHSELRPEGGYQRITVNLVRKPGDVSAPTRPLGWTTTGPWIVYVPKEELPNTFALLYHKCHPFWTTQTEFWP